jgi:collagen type XVIII alpha
LYSFSDCFSDEIDLQTAIKLPFDDPNLYFDNGDDGFPAFGIKPGSDIKSPYRLFLPEKLYPEFSIVVNFKLNSANGGFLFAVVNPLENVSVHPTENHVDARKYILLNFYIRIHID